jgi:hypothetical protein
MKPIHIFLLTVILLLLGGIYLWQQDPGAPPDATLFSKILPDLAEDKVGEIAVKARQDKENPGLTLRRNDGGWEVERTDGDTSFWAPAREERVERLLTALKELHGEKRAEEEDVLPTFALGDEEALSVSLKGEDGGELHHLLVGKRGPRPDTSFVRKASSKTVYLASENLLTLFELWTEEPVSSPGARSWTELTVVSQGPSEIEGISFSRGTDKWSLVRRPVPENETEEKAPVWDYTEGGDTAVKTDDETREAMKDLFPLRARDVAGPERSGAFGLGPGDQEGRLTLHLAGRGPTILHTGRLDEERDSAWIRDEHGIIYEVGADMFRGLTSPFSAGQEPEAEEITPSAGPRKD